jgi:chromosome partitioning protein
MATLIVVGNEKGGAGKTTVAVHLTITMLYLGFKVTSIDTDIRQASLSSYLENRKRATELDGINIPNPNHYRITPSKSQLLSEINSEEHAQLTEILAKAHESSDFIIIDTPGVNNYLSTLAHSLADIVVTPINDSFFDINVLAEVDANNFNIIKHGIYTQMIWEQKINKAKREGKTMHWVIMRNRLHNLDSNNRRNIEKVIDSLKTKVGCKLASGFGERIIFRELFLKGLTLLDIKNEKVNIPFTTSHLAARHELINLLEAINDDKINAALAANIL